MNTGMPTAVLSVLVQANGVSQTNAKLMRTQGILQATGNAGVRMGRQLATGLKYGALGAAAAIAVAVDKAITFDKEMRNVNSIAQLSERRFGKLREKVLALAGPTAQAPKTLAAGLYDLVSSGFDANESLFILSKSARAATAGLTTTEISTKAVAAVLNAYHLSAKMAGDTSDVLFEIVNRGVINFEELASQIGDVLPFSASLGVTLREVGASIATMTKAGISAPETMTRIKAVMVAMLKPSKDLSTVIKEQGYASGDAMIKNLGFQGTLDALYKATGGSKTALAALFPNVRALGGALALTGENSKVAAADLAGMKDASGATARALSQQSKSISYQWNQLKATAEVLAIKFGSKLLPELSKVMKVITDPKLTTDQKVTKVFEMIADAAGTALKEVANRVPGLAVKAAVAFAKAFMSASIWGKLAIGAFFIAKFGGKEAITAAGLAIGRMLGLGISTGAAETEAIGGATGSLTTVAGGAAGARWLGTDAAPKTASEVGMFGEKQVMTDVGLFGGGTMLSKIKPGLAKFGMAAGGVIGGYMVAEMGKSVLEKFGMGDPTEGQGIKTGLTHGFDTSGVKSSEERVLAQGKALEAAMHVQQAGERLLTSGDITRLKDIGAVVQQNMAAITQQFKTGTPLWREAVIKNMGSAVAAIHAGMHAGVIDAETGHQEIRRILHKQLLVSGNDPLKIAEGFKKSWTVAGGINEAQINSIERQLAKMPKGAREHATQSVLQMAKAWAQGHPKIEAQVNALNSALLTRFGRTNKQGVKGIENATSAMSNLFAGLVNNVSGYLKQLGVNVNSVLAGLGVKKTVDFSVNVVKAAGKAAGAAAGAVANVFAGNQQGGYIVPGTGTGDQFKTMLPAGSYVLNREATSAYGFNHGGMVPVELEPRERVFTPREVRSMGGLSTLETMNRTVRRQQGGSIGKPAVSGPAGPLRDMGQAAADKGYTAAKEYIAAHRPQLGPGAPSGPSGTSIFDGKPVANWIIPELLWARKHGWTGMVTSGWRDPNEVVHGTFATAPQGQSEHQYSHYPGGAVDLSEYEQFAKIIAGYPGPRKLIQLSIDPLHFSGTGHMMGGLIELLSSGGPAPTASGELVGASYYGGPTDGTSGTVGSSGVSLPGKMAFAELAMGTALGGLPYHSKLKIGYAGKSVVAEKLDIGAGGDAVNGKNRAIDLWYQTAQAIGMPGTAVVKVAAAGGAGATGLTDAQKKANEGKARKANYEKRLQALQQDVAGAKSDRAKSSKLWKLMRFWGQVGMFDKGEHSHFIESIQNAASQTSPGGTVKVLSHLAKYANDHGEITGRDPSNAHDLLKAIERAEDRGHKQRQHTLDKRAAKQTRAEKKISGRGEFAKWAAQLNDKMGAYEGSNQLAERLVALEPEDLGDAYVGQERGAWLQTLERLGGWRNSTVGARDFATGRKAEWERRIGEIELWNVPGVPEFEKKFKKEKWKIKPLHEAIANATGFISDRTDDMRGFQGVGGPQGVLDSLGEGTPNWLTIGGPGASIFDTQNTIRELGLKVGAGTGGSDQGTTEQLERVQELLRQANQRTLVAERQFDTLKQYKGSYAGMFAKGGVLGAGQWGIAGERGPEPVVGPARIVSNQDAYGGGATPTVVINGSIHQEPGDSRDPVEVLFGDPRTAPKIKQIINQGPAKGRRTPGGGR